MIAKQLIDKKREGKALGSAEIREFIEGFTAGTIPDYQMAAMAMAICCRGMTDRETADLTEAMKKSGRSLTWDIPTADKHSTGGMGDKLSLIIQPIVAACGVATPSLTGRGLGFTGGTADKLEAIPGYNASLSLDEFSKVVHEVGCSLTVQTPEICPADKKLYALRDVTGTVASIPLIVGSILSKKLAEGAHTLVFDVKTGSGAFMREQGDAETLATAMVNASKASGRQSAALVTDMNEPLGYAIGNANEVAEAIDILRGKDIYFETELCLKFATLMLELEKGITAEEARKEALEALNSGKAYEVFEKMVEAHGGSLTALNKKLAGPVYKFTLQAPKSGYIANIEAMTCGKVSLQLGGGRAQAGDKIDDLAGINLHVMHGDRVKVGDALATMTCSTEPGVLEKNAAELLKAFTIVSEKPAERVMVYKEIR